VAFYKYQTTKQINALRCTPDSPFWQRNYYEHIIRDEGEWAKIRDYIQTNPLRWETDDLHP
jgi:REP element-mobilizing transposase RayT